LSRSIILESAGTLACTAGAGAAGAGADLAAVDLPGAARVRAGRDGAAAGAVLRVVLRVPDKGVVAITLISGSVVCACAPDVANKLPNTIAADDCKRHQAQRRRTPAYVSTDLVVCTA